jgi:hypothetical protein
VDAIASRLVRRARIRGNPFRPPGADMSLRRFVIAAGLAILAALPLAGCGGDSAPTPAPIQKQSTISVKISPTSATVQASLGQTFTSTVSGDVLSKGVTWTVSGAGCAGNSCGTLSPTSSVSGETITYTAPSIVATALTVTVKATSVADGAKSSAATITVLPAPVVTVSPAIATVNTGGAPQIFTAAVQNDSQDKGVTWTVSGTACIGATCGTISPVSSSSEATVTYTSPANAAISTTVLLTATSVTDNAVTATATITLVAPPAPTPSSPLLLGAASVDEGFGEPVIATDSSGNIDVAWINGAGPEFVRSTDGGTTFSAPVNIPSDMQDTVDGNNIQMALDGGGSINLLWHRELTPTGTVPNSFFSRSIDGGATFSTPINPGDATSAQLLVEHDGSITIVWFDQTTSDLLAIHSSDGVNFSSPTTVATAVLNTNVMDLTAVSGPQNQIYIFWTRAGNMTDCSILASSSIDGGITFIPASAISVGAGSCNQTPSATVDPGGNVNVAWDADGTWVFFSRSTNAGATFSAPVSVRTSTNPSSPIVAIGPDATIYVLVDTVSGPALSRSTDEGATFSGILSPAVLGGLLAIDLCSNITVVGHGDKGRVEYQRSTDGGATFTDPIVVSDMLFNVEEQLAIDENGNVHIVWGVDGPPDIEYVRIPTTCSLH